MAKQTAAWRNRIVGHGDEDPSALTKNPRNWRLHPKAQQDVLSGVLDSVGFVQSIIVNQRSGFVVDGHARVALAISKRQPTVPVVYVDLDDHEEALILATLDPISAMAGRDDELLAGLLADIRTPEGAEALLGDAGLADLLASLDPGPIAADGEARPTLSDRFLVPPFSVLDARQGYWQERKRYWLNLGIESELGRGDVPGTNGLLGEAEQARSHYAEPGGSLRPAATLGKDGKTVRGDGRGAALANGRDPGRTRGQDLMRGEHVISRSDPRAIKDHAWQAAHLARPQARLTWVPGERAIEDMDDTSRRIAAAQPQSGTSIFDPVLCELAYRWFSPPDGHVLDPTAGGSVRGIVASRLGRHYTGVDLRPEQVTANRAQAHIATGPEPTWIVGDSTDIASLAPGEYDLIFSCPPYADLERYSDDPRDLSTQPYPEFLQTYRTIVAASVAMLRMDRFACFVVGDVRDSKGIYRNFVSDTIAAFQDAGAMLYNEAILVTAVGSLPIRVGKQFSSGRKLGKTHQNVLVFVKGDPRKATAACGEVEIAVPEDAPQEFGEEL